MTSQLKHCLSNAGISQAGLTLSVYLKSRLFSLKYPEESIIIVTRSTLYTLHVCNCNIHWKPYNTALPKVIGIYSRLSSASNILSIYEL